MDFVSGLQGTRLVTRVLIIVQNLPVPFDRRVWLECQALISDGYQVAVVCPKGNGDPAHEVINTVEFYKYRPYAPGGSKLSFVAEYAYSFLATAWLTLKARRSGRFGVIPGMQPTGHLLADRDGPSRSRRHPVRVRPSRPVSLSSTSPVSLTVPRLPYRALRALERWTHRIADHVISTNESYRDIAIKRSGKPASRRNGCPDRPGSGAAVAWRAPPRIAPRPPVPCRLHWRHGAAGRRGHRGARRRHRGP